MSWIRDMLLHNSYATTHALSRPVCITRGDQRDAELRPRAECIGVLGVFI